MGPESAGLFKKRICTYDGFRKYRIMLLKKGSEGKKTSWKDYLNPGLIACIAAFFIYWFQIELPEEIETLAGYYGNACTLLSMIVIGISLAGMKLSDMLKNRKLLAFAVIRFIAFPIVLALALKPVLTDLLIREVVILMAVLPVGNFPAMLCDCGRYCSDYCFISAYDHIDFYAGVITDGI